MKVRIDPGIALGVLVLACPLGFAGCASKGPAPRLPQPAAPLIQVDGESMPALDFDKIFLDIPDHLAIGYHHEGIDSSRQTEYRWGEHFGSESFKLDDRCRAILEEAGYCMATDDPASIRFEGSAVKYSYNSYAYKTSFNQAECEMRWDLFRADEKLPYFTRLTTGAARADGNDQGATMAAFEIALRNLLAQEEFVAAVGGRKSP